MRTVVWTIGSDGCMVYGGPGLTSLFERGSDAWWNEVFDKEGIGETQEPTVVVGNPDDVQVSIYERDNDAIGGHRFFGVIEAGPTVDVVHFNDWPGVLSFTKQWFPLLRLLPPMSDNDL